jgi:hypothetical protein
MAIRLECHCPSHQSSMKNEVEALASEMPRAQNKQAPAAEILVRAKSDYNEALLRGLSNKHKQVSANSTPIETAWV